MPVSPCSPSKSRGAALILKPLTNVALLSSLLFTCFSTLLLASTAAAAVRGSAPRFPPFSFPSESASPPIDNVNQQWRQQSLALRSDSGEVQAAIAALSQTDPFAAATEADNQADIKGATDGNDNSIYSLTPDDGDFAQFTWNKNVYLNPGAATNGSDEGGWQGLPDTAGFTLNRSTSIYNSDKSGSGIMPFYISNEVMTPENIKRAILLWPGKPRDAWNYANLMLNARSVVAQNFASWGVTNDSVLILAPVFLALQDMTAGGGRAGEFAFGGGLWQEGSHTRLPNLTKSLTSYEIMDFFTDMLADQSQFPNLNQIVVAGHSLGGQAAQRYALLKKAKKYDYNVRFWVGNPGSWAWITSNLPYTNSSCPVSEGVNSPTSWPYGLNGNLSEMTSYARKDVQADQSYVISRYIMRKVAYGLGLLDNGPGTTSCEAQWQGANHLDRGSQFILNFQNNSHSNHAFPANHTVDFIANVSHQDYAMYSTNMSLQRLFYDDYNVRYPDTASTLNPGDSGSGGSGSKYPDRAFATAAHEKIAISLLVGSAALIALFFTCIFYAFEPNYDMSWEKELPPPPISRHGSKVHQERMWG